MKYAIQILLVIGVLLLAACNVNESIDVAAGAHSDGGTTVNGSITVHDNAEVTGTLRTVNGKIRVGDHCKVSELTVVNGDIKVGQATSTGPIQAVNGGVDLGLGVDVDGRIMTVNGKIKAQPRTHVDGDLGSVNGKIELHGTIVTGEVENHHGGMLITDGSVIQGDVAVRKSDSDNDKSVPRVVIGPDTQVQGRLIFERPVHLYVHESAKIGEVQGATPERYSDAIPEER